MKSVQSGPRQFLNVSLKFQCTHVNLLLRTLGYSSVLWSFTSHAAPNHNSAGEFTCFLQEVIWICFGFSGCKFHFIPSAALGHFLFSGHIPEIFLTSIYSYLSVIFLFRLCLLDVLHTTNWENVHNVATVCIGLSFWRTYNNHSVFSTVERDLSSVLHSWICFAGFSVVLCVNWTVAVKRIEKGNDC